MAIQKGNFLSGAVGPVVNYEFRGKQVIRTKPMRVKQTKATKASAKDFGRAVRLSKYIREVFSLLGTFDKFSLMYRMNRALIQWFKYSQKDPARMDRESQALKGFELNEECELSRYLKIQPVVGFETGKIMFDLPELRPSEDIVAPRNTNSIRLNLVAFSCGARENDSNSGLNWYSQQHLDLDFTQTSIPAQHLDIPYEIIVGDLVLVAMSLQYDTGSLKYPRVITDKKWTPAAVIGVRYVVS